LVEISSVVSEGKIFFKFHPPFFLFLAWWPPWLEVGITATKLCGNDPWVVPFHNCVRQRRPVSKMATITKNRNFFKWPKLLYFKPESAAILDTGRC
jgi:hypothetical protein